MLSLASLGPIDFRLEVVEKKERFLPEGACPLQESYIDLS